jgi:hypothetical protein
LRIIMEKACPIPEPFRARSALRRRKLNWLITVLTLSFATAGSDVDAATFSQEPAAAKNTTSASIFDTVWALPVLYSDKSNPVAQRLALIGRYHGQYYTVGRR